MGKYLMLYLMISIITHGVYNSDNKTLIKIYFWSSMIGISILYLMDSIHWFFLLCSTMILLKPHLETLEEMQRREKEEMNRRWEAEALERKQAFEIKRSSPDHF